MKKMKDCRVLCHVFAWIAFTCYSPFLFVIFSFLFLWKYGVEQVTKVFKMKLISIFNPYDGIMVAVDPYWESSKSSLALILVVDGSIDIEKFRNRFTEEILHTKSQNVNSHGKPLFEKLLQIPITFGGYYFWSKANYFLVHEHIRLVEQTMTTTQLKKFAATVMNLPFPNKRPLWEILIFPNYQPETDAAENQVELKPNKSAVVLRVHHAVADSWTLMNLLHCMLTGRQPEPESSTNTCNIEKYNFTSFSPLEKITFILKLPLQLLQFYIDLLFYSDWFTTKHLESDEGFVSWTIVRKEALQKITSSTALGQSALGVTLFSGAFGKYVAELQRNCPTINADGNEISSTKQEDTVETLRVCFPLTWMSIPNKFHSNYSVNWQTATMAKVPLRRHMFSNNAVNMTSTNSSISSSLRNGLPQLISLFINLLSLIPRHVLRYIMSCNKLGMSLIFQDNPSFPAISDVHDDEILLWGHKVEEIIPSLGFHSTQTALTVNTLQFKGDYVITFMSNTELVCGYQATLDRIVQELLHKDLESILQEVEDVNGFISIPIV